jgi:23S rRNA (uracil1939-C5)-methyltransferase
MTITVDIESLDQEGRGVAHADGKVVFVTGALTGERVAIEILKRKPSYDTARVATIERASASRVTPRCPHFGVCGGCTLQHAAPALQIAAKQRALEDAFARIGRVRPETLLPPIDGAAWGYRYRARLSVRHVPKKGGVLVGFHERQSSYVADMRECHVMPRKLSDLLVPLRTLIESLTIRDRLPQIEVAIGERLNPPAGSAPPMVYALVMRVLEPPSPIDEAKLVAFADMHGVDIWLQPGGPGTVAPFHPKNSTLAYTLPEFEVALPFAPTDFTQVNFGVTACWCGVRWRCSRRSRASASPTSSAGSATSRCRSRAAAPWWSASKATRRWYAGRRRTRYAMPSPNARPLSSRTCSRRRANQWKRSVRCTAR